MMKSGFCTVKLVQPCHVCRVRQRHEQHHTHVHTLLLKAENTSKRHRHSNICMLAQMHSCIKPQVCTNRSQVLEQTLVKTKA